MCRIKKVYCLYMYCIYMYCIYVYCIYVDYLYEKYTIIDCHSPEPGGLGGLPAHRARGHKPAR